jgi:hypothetical protein
VIVQAVHQPLIFTSQQGVEVGGWLLARGFAVLLALTCADWLFGLFWQLARLRGVHFTAIWSNNPVSTTKLRCKSIARKRILRSSICVTKSTRLVAPHYPWNYNRVCTPLTRCLNCHNESKRGRPTSSSCLLSPSPTNNPPPAATQSQFELLLASASISPQNILLE